ncbi:unnamed protein product [Prunus brigantina]
MRIRAPSPVNIGVGGETSCDSLGSEGEAEINSALDVSKYPFGGNKVRDMRSTHELSSDVDSKRYVRRVRVRHCKLPTSSQYLVGLEMRALSETERTILAANGVDASLELRRLAFYKRSCVYLS